MTIAFPGPSRPFPWTYNAESHAVEDHLGHPVAFIPARLGDEGAREVGALLAAAGELQAALQDIVKAVESIAEIEMRGARAALKKAEGS